MTLLLTVAETCEMLAVSRSSLWKLAKSGQLQPVKLGRATRYRRADVEAFAAGLAGAA